MSSYRELLMSGITSPLRLKQLLFTTIAPESKKVDRKEGWKLAVRDETGGHDVVAQRLCLCYV